jgi:Flp pilus assembly protein TadD
MATRRTLSLIFLLTTSLIPLYASGYEQAKAMDEAEAHANRGLELAQAGNLAAAEGELRQAARLAPNDSEVLGSLGTVLAMEKKLEESTPILQRAVKLSPGDVTLRRYLAANLWQLRRFAEAKSNLEILLKQHPDDRHARLLLGMVAENTKDYLTAVKMLSSVPEQVRQQPESIAALARSYYRTGGRQKGRDTLAQLTQRPGGKEAVLLGAEIADQMQDYTTAEKLLQSFPSDDGDLVYRLALVQYHAGNLDASARTLLTTIDAGNASSQMYNLLAWCRYRNNHPKEAVESLERAIALAPAVEDNYLDLGTILVSSNSLPSALALARKATTAVPSSAKLFELRGSIETRVGQFNDAVASYARAVALDSSRPTGIAGLAKAQFSAGMTQEAMATFENGVKRFPKDVELRLSYGAALKKQAEAGDSQASRRAKEMFRAAVALDAGSSAAHYELGKSYLENRNLEEAIPHLEKAVKLDAKSPEAHFALSRAYRQAGRAQEAAREIHAYQNLKNAPSSMPLRADRPTAQERF